MALVDFAIVGLSIGFVVICWINSRDSEAVTSTPNRSSSVIKTKLPGIGNGSIMDRFSEKNETSEPVVASAISTQYEAPIVEETTPSTEIPEFDDVDDNSPKMAKIECPNCSNIITIEEKGITQKLTCDSCGFSGDIEV